jgi:hypothetical protein
LLYLIGNVSQVARPECQAEIAWSKPGSKERRQLGPHGNVGNVALTVRSEDRINDQLSRDPSAW